MNVFMIMEQVERLASAQLWPGFYPLMIPLAIYDDPFHQYQGMGTKIIGNPILE